MNFINTVDNHKTISNNIFIISKLRIIYNLIDKEKTTPFLLWPVKDNQTDNEYSGIKFLHIKQQQQQQQDNNIEIKPLSGIKFIQYQVFEDSDLIYTFNKDRLFIYKLDISNNGWSLISSKTHDNLQFTNKTIHHYYYNYCRTNLIISIVVNSSSSSSGSGSSSSNNQQQLIYIFKNVVNTDEITINIIPFNEINEFSNLQIVDLKWSFCGLILSICTSKEIILLKWKSYYDIGSKEYQQIRYNFKDSNNNDIIKFNWIDSIDFTITTYPSIQFSKNNNNNTQSLKLPSTIKPSIQLFSKEINKEGEQKETDHEIFILKPQPTLNSPIQSLFMINHHENISTTKTTNTITSTIPLIQPIGNDTIISQSIDNKQQQQNEIGPCLVLFKLNDNDEITTVDKLLLNEHMSIPNIVLYKNGVICISSTYSKYIELVKIKPGVLIHHKSISLDQHYSQYQFKELSFIQLHNNQTFKLYGLAGEPLNKKGIGLSFKTTTDWKISLFSSNETIDLISNTQQQQQQQSSIISPVPSIDSFLNFQQLFLSKLTNIENTLNNHSIRLTNIENSIDKIIKKI